MPLKQKEAYSSHSFITMLMHRLLIFTETFGNVQLQHTPIILAVVIGCTRTLTLVHFQGDTSMHRLSHTDN